MKTFDWDDAYDNSGHILDAASYPRKWQTEADAFRSSHPSAILDLRYGPGARNNLDIFLPGEEPKGLAVFVHGGYWMKFDKSTWSQLAQGSVDAGWAMALPSYTLAPDASISQITREIAAAVTAAAERVAGPIRLSGHSAGGHLVSRMACENSPLAGQVRKRMTGVVSISGLHDLEPLRNTKMNATLRIDDTVAVSESAVRNKPVTGLPVTAWVGSSERPEFLRQSRLLAGAWPNCIVQIDDGRHHFDIIEGLRDKNSPLCCRLLD
ncbi:alpha/beta hydrolase [Pseudoruegeria sp. HB172150]|uniref:alpha/beta hydrolase n=1 Tax=Pseudoruegeria sp. HB172150 TaxID=2721164 RepID=UPI0015521C11|nr:alpha/beta hydrolase [Pseudoruegeria sp. HB172150]